MKHYPPQFGYDGNWAHALICEKCELIGLWFDLSHKPCPECGHNKEYKSVTAIWKTESKIIRQEKKWWQFLKKSSKVVKQGKWIIHEKDL